MLIWCLKEVKNFILKFSLNWSFFSGRQNYLNYYNTFYFRWRCWWSVGEVVVTWSKDTDTMCISFSCSVSNIQRHTFQEKRSLSEYHKNYFQYIYIPFYSIIGDINITKVKFMIRNQEIEATFILGPLFFKLLVVFKSL